MGLKPKTKLTYIEKLHLTTSQTSIGYSKLGQGLVKENMGEDEILDEIIKAYGEGKYKPVAVDKHQYSCDKCPGIGEGSTISVEATTYEVYKIEENGD